MQCSHEARAALRFSVAHCLARVADDDRAARAPARRLFCVSSVIELCEHQTPFDERGTCVRVRSPQTTEVFARSVPPSRELRVLRVGSRALRRPRASRCAHVEGALCDAPLAHRASSQFMYTGIAFLKITKSSKTITFLKRPSKKSIKNHPKN